MKLTKKMLVEMIKDELSAATPEPVTDLSLAQKFIEGLVDNGLGDVAIENAVLASIHAETLGYDEIYELIGLARGENNWY
jgi:hypothetical protein